MGPELLVLAAPIKKIVDFVRSLRGKDTNAVATQLVAWAAGILTVYVAAHVDLGGAFGSANEMLDSWGLWAQTVAGFVLGSGASLVQDTFKAVDNTQSESKPKLVQGTTTDVR
jgi:hypothetical protein